MANTKKTTTKTTAKKTAKPVAKKAPAKKTAASKTTTKKAPAKKATAKKPAVKTTKTAVKKTAAKKAVPAKAVKKSAVKSAAKVTAKKAPVKKTTAVKKVTTKSTVKTAAKSASKPVAKKAPVKKNILASAPVPAAMPEKKIPVKTVSDNKAMGRGLSALLSMDDLSANKIESVVDLKINDISPNDGQPRKVFKDESLNELAASIKEIGVIQPILVQRAGEGYRIIAGERRWRASRIAGLTTIPAIVRDDLSDTETMAQALIENILREDLNPIEEASAMKDLLVTHKLTQEKLSNLLGKPRATIANTIRILNLDESLQEFVSRGDLSEGHAKVILALKDKEDQRKVADVIMARDMNVRQAEVFVKKYIEAQNKPGAKKTAEMPDIQFTLSTKEVETKLKKQLGRNVKIKVLDTKTGRGRIVIDYKDNLDLDGLIEYLCNG
jgi:ParB family chromosome partitioning protein